MPCQTHFTSILKPAPVPLERDAAMEDPSMNNPCCHLRLGTNDWQPNVVWEVRRRVACLRAHHPRGDSKG